MRGDPISARPGSDGRRPAGAASYHQQPMALLIASDLHKDIAGEPLLRGVSFKLERRERLTLAGRNGAGKTTLLRMLAGESSIDGGELSVAKGVRIALHDQRPPRERGVALQRLPALGLRRGARDRGRAGRARAGDGRRRGRRGDARPLRRRAGTTRDARRLPVAQPRERRWPTASASATRTSSRTLDTFSGGRADARLAGAGAGHRRRRAAARRAHQPPRHRLPGMARADARGARRGGRAGRPRPLVPGGGRHRRARAARPAARASSPAAGTSGAASRRPASSSLGKAIDAQQAEIERTERFIERFRYKATKAKQAQSRVKRLEKIERLERDPRDERGLEFAFKAPERSGRVIFELQDGRVEVGARPARDAAASTPSCGSSGASTCRWWVPTGPARRP